VMNLVGPDAVLLMGSDLSEVCTTRAQAEELLQNDFRLWDSSSFGEVRHVFTEKSGSLVTAFFEVPFTFKRGGDEHTVVIRFTTVWRKTPGGLKLVQSANTVPTVGQSAKELLSPRH